MASYNYGNQERARRVAREAFRDMLRSRFRKRDITVTVWYSVSEASTSAQRFIHVIKTRDDIVPAVDAIFTTFFAINDADESIGLHYELNEAPGRTDDGNSGSQEG